MKLSLSVRIAESPRQKDRAEMPIEDLAPMARAAGFEGLSMRASVVSVTSSAERIREVRSVLDANHLTASMVMGNVALAANSPDAPDCLRDIEPHLDLALALGARLVRIMIHSAADIPHAQRAADAAAERGLTLSHPNHWGTLCETVDESLDLVRRIGRPNFGITFEPANLLACGGPYSADAVARLAPHIVNAYFQNMRLDPNSAMVFKSRRQGPVGMNYVALDDPLGIDPHPIVAALRAAGYDGWFGVHQPLRPGQTVPDAIDEAQRTFGKLIAGH